jgi:nucleoid DNA-binding protein
MRKIHWGALGVLTATLAVALIVANPAQSQRIIIKDGAKDSLRGRLARAGDIPEEKVDKLLKELGPAISDQLSRGQKVELPGLGAFRVVRVPEHRDLVNGRPTMIAATNYVEFVPVQGVVDSANAASAVPADTVPIWEFNPNSRQVPSQSVPNTRVPSTRIR